MTPPRPLVGQPATASLSSAGLAETDAAPPTWLPLPAAAARVEGSREGPSLTFVPLKAGPLSLTVEPGGGGRCTVQVEVRPFQVQVSFRGAQGPRPGIWSHGRLVESANRLAVGQKLRFRAGLSPPLPAGELGYVWQGPGPAEAIIQPQGAEIEVTPQKTGRHRLMVQVRDAEGLVLGQGEAVFAVEISAADLARAAQHQDAALFLTRARSERAGGRLPQALALAREAQSLDPGLTDAGTLLRRWQEDLKRQNTLLDQAQKYLAARDFVQARERLGQARGLGAASERLATLTERLAREEAQTQATLNQVMQQVRTAQRRRNFAAARRELAAFQQDHPQIPPAWAAEIRRQNLAVTRDLAKKEEKRALFALARDCHRAREFKLAQSFLNYGLKNAAAYFGPDDTEVLREALQRSQDLSQTMSSLKRMESEMSRALAEAQQEDPRRAVLEKGVAAADNLLAVQPWNHKARQGRDTLLARLGGPAPTPPRP
ncbi:MAG: hypothetical protein KQJ78_04415 [Deltaproteobacteria bacterium]|nr:hypothetical protein [Deltaproteobacteria bacterium]